MIPRAYVDLVQIRAGPIGPTLNAMRETLDPWLGKPSWKRSHASVKLIYRLALGRDSASWRKLKLEINTREHGSAFGLTERQLSLESRWFAGSAEVSTYELDELLATKLRALYQRQKGRDLFDLATAHGVAEVHPERVVDGFDHYLSQQGLRISRAEFEANLARKIEDPDFVADVRPLVAEGTEYDIVAAAGRVREDFISARRLAGAGRRLAAGRGADGLRSSEMLEPVFQRFQQCACRTIPVVAGGRLAGIVTMDNVGEFVSIQSALRR